MCNPVAYLRSYLYLVQVNNFIPNHSYKIDYQIENGMKRKSNFSLAKFLWQFQRPPFFLFVALQLIWLARKLY